jgi:hypothetical protein
MTRLMLLVRLTLKATPFQMAGQIIQAILFSINQYGQDRKPTSRLTAALLPRFRYRWIVITLELVEKQPKNRWRF